MLTDSCSSKFERIERKMVKYQNSTAHDRSKWNWSKLVWKIKFFTNLAIDSIRQQLLLFGAFRSLLKLYEVYTCNRNNVLYRYISWLNEFLFVFFLSSLFWMWKGSFVVLRCSKTHSPNYCVFALYSLLGKELDIVTNITAMYMFVCTLKRSWCTAQKLNWIGYSKMEHTHTHKHAKHFFFILMKTTSSWMRSDTQKV